MRVCWLLVCAALAGCATSEPPPLFARIDGQPSVQSQFNADAAICVGRMQQARVMAPAINTPAPTAGGGVGQSMSDLGGALSGLADTNYRNAALKQIYVGCMAERGWAKAN